MFINKIIGGINSFKAVAQSTDNSHNNRQFSSSALEKSPNEDTFQISIGYVNDTHGQTNNMMRILSGISGDIVVSAGDNDIGDEKNKEVHAATARFLNLANVVATAVGNHEMDTTQEDLINSFKEYNADPLVVNIKKDKISEQDSATVKELGRASIDEYWKPSKIVTVNGQKIGLLGASPMDMMNRLTHPNYHTDCHVDNLEDTIKDIQEEVNNLRAQGVNKIILLSHLGLKKDKQVVQKTEGIDVVICGHSHELLKGIKEGENLLYSKSGEPVILTEAGRDGNYFGKLNLTFNNDGIITKAQNNLGNTGLYRRNLVYQYLFNLVLGKPERIGFVEKAPIAPESIIEENPHANFVCDIMKEETNSDIAIWHNCGVRNFFHEGEINSRDVKDISPFLDFVVTANVSEKTLVDTFKKAIKNTYSSSSHKPGLFAVSGLDYSVNEKEGKLTGMNYIDKSGNIHKIDIDNPSENKKYKVVTDEFLMSAGADFNILAKEDEYIEKYPYDKDVMVCNYIKRNNKPIIIDQLGRIKFE